MKEARDRTDEMALPEEPMIPVASQIIPQGADWGYQLKWDGVRMLARIDNGRIELFSRKLVPKNSAYPEIVKALAHVKGPCLIDGEAFVFDAVKARPVFAKVLTRERLRKAAAIARTGHLEPVRLALFDVLYAEGLDWRHRPYRERHEELSRLFPEKKEQLFVTDLFTDGSALWRWVEENGWEGMVSKRLSSPYREGKRHEDWLKKKTALVMIADIVGYTFNEGRLASLVMMSDGLYLGRVSLGLTEEIKRELLTRDMSGECPFPSLPPDLKGLTLSWLKEPFSCKVTGLEITEAGLLRHSKLMI